MKLWKSCWAKDFLLCFLHNFMEDQLHFKSTTFHRFSQYSLLAFLLEEQSSWKIRLKGLSLLTGEVLHLEVCTFFLSMEWCKIQPNWFSLAAPDALILPTLLKGWYFTDGASDSNYCTTRGSPSMCLSDVSLYFSFWLCLLTTFIADNISFHLLSTH